MTSFVANDVTLPGRKTTFTIEGRVTHRIVSVLALPNEPDIFLQIYFLKNRQAKADIKRNMFQKLKRETVLEIQELLYQHNVYIRDFISAMPRAGTGY